ncbi:MAG: hypothetical protein K5986_02055 [Clostridium sp.]|uniref:hypothetical protein n=1 Tax=Clostridium sp. DSM 8431 TaxID=1761781 RepID=UPI0008F2D3E5|nr:hypothetical protein [Clostridium sp. DSM 8431]MCR4943248.1 hypothetical protein [Clostridium sp.]SFU40684.1 hypothetical protein SAMN04487886_102025 [Clostridium sp. DSM 8431]
MKVTIVDFNNIEAYIALEDGRILSIPSNTIKAAQIGDTLDFPNENLPCSSNRYNQSSVISNGLIDFL